MMLPISLGIAVLAMALVSGWLLLSLHRSQERIGARLDAMASSRIAPAPGLAAVPEPARSAPEFALPALDGRVVSLSGLLATGKRTLLNFTDPKCGPCYELLADTGGWERVYGDRLTIVTISSGDPRQNQLLAQEYGLGTVLLQEEHEIADAFGLPMIPAAVLIDPDGQTMNSATGAPQVRQLVASALGMALPPQKVQELQPLKPGQPVGNLRRPDLDGNLIDLGERRPEPTLLVFWSPGCSHCQDLLPAMQEWDTASKGPRMVVVTSGPAGLNRDVGLSATMIQDDDGALKRVFGVQATPSAVLIDGGGQVASEVARGATAVRAVIAHILGITPVAA